MRLVSTHVDNYALTTEDRYAYTSADKKVTQVTSTPVGIGEATSVVYTLNTNGDGSPYVIFKYQRYVTEVCIRACGGAASYSFEFTTILALGENRKPV
ncbi:hypothetical protein RI054_01g05790 [Pseudoscourfieldia marina]